MFQNLTKIYKNKKKAHQIDYDYTPYKSENFIIHPISQKIEFYQLNSKNLTKISKKNIKKAHQILT